MQILENVTKFMAYTSRKGHASVPEFSVCKFHFCLFCTPNEVRFVDIVLVD